MSRIPWALMAVIWGGVLVPWTSSTSQAQETAPAPASSVARADQGVSSFAGETPEELEGIEIEDHAGRNVPEDISLVDESGQPVRLGDFYGQGRPLLVQLVYYECPMLCSQVLNGFVETARSLSWTPGREFEVLTVSFDPRDGAEVAARKKSNYVEALGKPEAAPGWHFLTGTQTEVARLAEAVGFRYRWVEDQKEFAHAAGMFVLTPDGRVSRTLYGMQFTPRDLRLSLVEAGEGRLGSPFDRLLLYCFQYDGRKHTYALMARNVMKVGGLLTVIALGIFVGALWSRDRRLRHAVQP